LGDESDVFRGREQVWKRPSRGKKRHAQGADSVLNNEKGLADVPGRAKKPDPKIAKMNTNYKLPSISLLKEGEGSQKLDEDELKMRARAIEAKCHEFEVEGRVTQINPGRW